jgi:hypothetical protein
MNTLKTIYDKLGDKTELAKHEVELGKIDDFKKMLNDSKNLTLNFTKEYEKLLVVARGVNNLANNYIASVEKLNSVQSNIENQFKELGLDWGSTPEKKAYNDLLIKQPISNYKKIQGGLQQI